jgi:cytochrome c biogenesis protein CcmG, thiol:disulfide interchange protein DsbE
MEVAMFTRAADFRCGAGLISLAAAVLIGGFAAAAPANVGLENGNAFDLAHLRGRVVLVNYWATWCAPCRKEMPTLDAFYRRHHPQGLEMIGISIDFQKDIEKARKMAKTVGYPTAHIGGISDDGFGTQKGVPVTYVVDVDGVVRDKFIATPDKLLNDVVVPLLQHAEPAQ